MAPPNVESPAPTAIGNRADFDANGQVAEHSGSDAEPQEMPLSNSLADLAERVREAGAAVAEAERTAVERAVATGFLLCQAKDQCRHGEWLPFLVRAGIAERQAQRYMRLARAGLKPDTLSDLGSVAAALDYIAGLILPAPGDIVFISRRHGEGPEAAWISCSTEHPGLFDVTSIGANQDVLGTTRPVSSDAALCADGYLNGVWAVVDLMVTIPPSEREFTAMPAELLEDVDDCPWLDEVEEPVEIHALDLLKRNARLPLSYQRVAECLYRCEAGLTEANVVELQRLMSICLFRSEKWPTGQKMIPTYARIADEKQMSDRVLRIEGLARLKWGRIPGGAT